jgi:hypothetical protein
MIKTSGQLDGSDYKLFKREEKNLKKLGKKYEIFFKLCLCSISKKYLGWVLSDRYILCPGC